MTVEVPTKVIHPSAATGGQEALAAQLADEMAQRWRTGERPRAEEYLGAHPELWNEPEAAIRVIYEEVCLREEHGVAVPAAEILRRFPRWRAQLEVMLDCHRLLEAPPAPVLPEVATTLGEYFLQAELGRGAQGRVYLASQPALGDRRVVLKITPRSGNEHLTLARLQHTHIMPLYAVHEDAARHLRTMCMPYFGGAALNRILAELCDIPVAKRMGRDLLDTLDRLSTCIGDHPGQESSTRAMEPARQIFARVSYAEAVCWIGVCLAEALQYAHERGLVHLDIKPSNVLLAADGQPMLLDFHVAQKPILPGGPFPEWLGGTPIYMSPEQQAAMTAAQSGSALTATVDGRSDIFSLGLLLYEALGFPSQDQGPVTSLHRRNPQVSVGFADIIGKCLAPDAHDRYPTAAALAEDMRRHLGDQPLRGVGNRSWRERWHKWRRRRPYALPLTVMAASVLAAALSLGVVIFERAGQYRGAAEAALAEGQQHLKARSHAKAVDSLARGLALAQTLPGRGDLARELETLLHRARRALAAEQLHALVDRLRYLYGGSVLPSGESQSLASRWRAVWDKRDLLKDPRGGAMEPELEQRLDTDLLDLGMIWADLCVRLADPGQEVAAQRESLQILADTEALFGSSHVLCLHRQNLALALGKEELARTARACAAATPPRTPWEHCALGRSLLQAGKLDQAAAALEKALELQPQGFWPNFYLGVCSYRQKRLEEAVNAFRVCIALAPENAACYYNRALAEAALGRTERAQFDYTRALQLEPDMASAALNRGLLRLGQKRYADARADLRLALHSGSDPALVHYNLALVDLEQNDRPAAIADLQRALRANAGHKAARTLLDRLQR